MFPMGKDLSALNISTIMPAIDGGAFKCPRPSAQEASKSWGQT
jgi:hypothetical protein